MATLKEIRQEVGKQLGGLVITSTAGATGSFTVDNDPRFIGATGVETTAFTGHWALPTAGNASGQVRRCVATTASSGLTTVEPDWTSAVATDEIELHSKLHPDVIEESIFRAMRDMYHEQWFPLTLVANGAFDETTLTNWTGTNATLALDTDASDVVSGSGSMSITATSANGFAQSDNITVKGDETYFLQVDVRATGAVTVEVQAWDVTNGAELSLVGNDNEWGDNDWGILYFSFVTLTTTDNVTIRIVIQENSGVGHADNVILMKSQQNIYSAPTWVQNSKADTIEVLQEMSNFEDARSRTFTTIRGFSEITANVNAATPAQIILPFSPVTPIWVKAIRPFLSENGTLASDSTTTNVNFNWVVTRTLVECYGLLRDQQAGVENKFWRQRRLEALARAKRLNRRWNPGKTVRRVVVRR